MALTPHLHSFPTNNLLTVDEPTYTCHYHPESIVYMRVHSWCCIKQPFEVGAILSSHFIDGETEAQRSCIIHTEVEEGGG